MITALTKRNILSIISILVDFNLILVLILNERGGRREEGGGRREEGGGRREEGEVGILISYLYKIQENTRCYAQKRVLHIKYNQHEVHQSMSCG